MDYYKEDRWRGARFKFITGLLLIVAGLGIAFFIASQTHPFFLKIVGASYDPTVEMDEQPKALTVTDIDLIESDIENVLSDHYQFYILKHTEGTSLSRSSKDDQQMQALVDHFSKSSRPKSVAVVVYNAEEILENSFKSYVKDGKISDTHLLILNEEPADVSLLYVIAAITSLGGLYICWSALTIRKRHRKAYEALYTRFPELRTNLSLLQKASFVDEKNGIYLYKECLVIFAHEIYLIDCKKVKSIYTDVQTKGNDSKKDYFLTINTIDPALISLSIEETSKENIARLEQLYQLVINLKG